MDYSQKQDELRLLNLRDRREDIKVAKFLEKAARKIMKARADELIKVPLIPRLAHLDPSLSSLLGKRKPRTLELQDGQDQELPWMTAFSHLG